ncbi:S-adenosyl-L-methionine-dependent methyltransferase [Parachaetomium inaequale]|uniref:S-adenosyl-L-methionine-dependent methyltransferase n=1 Tax=Parachaetomium inaequale TaxID=2588326 RepID=A0AAN6PKS9_9PEZI|nr:S-adenosyl-L-methionine-dependent methyltransferase [Parachaetomium inaequale]
MPLPDSLASLLHPWQFMALSLSFLPPTLLSALLALDLRTLLSPSRLRAAWFGRFWARVGPDVRLHAEANVIPLLQGHVTHGIIPPASQTTTTTTNSQERPHPPVSGTVLEIGPGSGMWTSLFTPQTLPSIRKVYGVEPNTTVHPLLRQQITAAGLTETYEILPLGIEDLAASGRVPLASVDCIVTVMCLCSIPEPRHNMAQLYGYLKPGGRWYAYEHVKCFREQGWGMRAYQAFLNILWPRLIGGCEMCRDTGKWLKEAGPWSKVDLCQLEGEPWYFTMPHVIGVLTK